MKTGSPPEPGEKIPQEIVAKVAEIIYQFQQFEGVLKTCPRCLAHFEEKEDPGHSPVRDLGDMVLESTTRMNPEDLCADCREEIGLVSLFGFGR